MPRRFHLPAIPRSLGSRGIVFFAGFSMMTIELLAARVTAPYLGSSLYTWTGIIAFVLLGIAVGAFVGGKLADRRPPRHASDGAWPRRVLAISLLAAGALTAVGYGVAALIGPWLGARLSVPAAMPLFALCVFFPPSVFLAAVQPAAIKTDLAELAETGRVVGLLGSWNAAGSILGTYLAGFVFNYYLSTRLVWLSIAVALFAAGGWTLFRKPSASARRTPSAAV
ncbi:MAG: fused MFS/spermidine synthase [Patescibacteria group bacterium]